MKSFIIKTSKKEEMIDITEKVNNLINIEDGICIVHSMHTTTSIIINENYDPNICKDILNALRKLVPDRIWLHDKIDNNASAHIKSSIMGPSEIIPIKDGKLQLGTWQRICFCEFDGPRERKVIVEFK